MEMYHFPDMKNRTHHDSIMMISRIGWTLFPFLPRTVFPRNGGGGNGKRHGYDLYRDGCQHKLGSLFFFFLPVLKGLLNRKTQNAFTTSKDHSNFYHSGGAREKRENEIKATFLKTIKWGVVHFQESK